MFNVTRRAPRREYRRCAFAGYRPHKMPFGNDECAPECIRFKRILHQKIEALVGEGYAHFLSGGAMGMDMYAAEAVLQLREQYPWILLEMVSPFDAQADRWSDCYRRRHDLLFERADIVTATAHTFSKSCMFRRNRYLVDNADMLLAAYNGQPGGTAMTVAYAREIGIPVSIVWLEESYKKLPEC